MGVITGIREKLHFVLYALVAAFIALIVFEWGMNFNGFSGGGALAGKVNGKPIEYRHYERVYESLVDNFRSQALQAELTDAVERELRQRAWDIVVNQIILEEQLEKYNIRVSDEEVVAAVESDNPPMVIVQNFFDQETGSIDREKLEKARMAPENKEIWIRIEDIIRGELVEKKLQQTLNRMVRVSDAELEAVVDRELGSFSASFIPVPYSMAGNDTLFTVTDKEVEDYYNENREMFRQEPTRALDYAVFSAVPSSRDSMSVKNELESLAVNFAEADDDSAFVNLQSDRSDAFDKRYSRADFSVEAGDYVFDESRLEAGGIIGPVADRNAYRLIKVKDVSNGEPVARASHILIPFEEGDATGEAAARETAAVILQDIRAGKRFADLAEQYSQDEGSSSQGGDLGWFARNTMVPEFDEAVFGATTGSLIGPVETRYGLHIISVTGRDTKTITCSEIVRNIRPSDATLENARRKAAEFQIEAEENGFDRAAETLGIDQHTTGYVTKTDMIPEIGYNNTITRFAFTSSKGAVSDVIQTDSGFLVMQVSGNNDSGYRKLDEELQGVIRSELLTRKKGEALDQKLSALLEEKNGNLDAVAGALDGVSVVTAENIRFNEQEIPGYGRDIRLMEAIIGMEPGSVSKPVAISDGRALILLHKKTYEKNDLESRKNMLRAMLEQVKEERFVQDYFAAERRAATIEDLRGF
ncbi:peptidylprolyl isomerase [Prosthecochloris marina]|uniref:Periplasmic chaperone PpiD n=1 Tax=Prosthecochloris marina TaxID=2017681 RepID=A0A317T6X1_9CHLB|nr:peptidylprolyl isomerase [Prosthecochloris marina]PWW82364.1 peptidylprolyl isomerase [Prosthecochloris marina]